MTGTEHPGEDSHGHDVGPGSPRAHADDVLVFPREAGRIVDAEAIKRFGIPGIVLMENAARGVADLARLQLGAFHRPGRVLVACGRGNNGGDGWAAARHLANHGHDVRIISLGSPREGSDALINAGIAERMQLPVVSLEQDGIGEVDLVIDAIFGTGLDRAIDGGARALVEAINEHDAPVLAVDIPSGLDADTGMPLGTAIRAAWTASFMGYKAGFLQPGAFPFLGELHVIDIGVPRELLLEHGSPLPGARTEHGRRDIP